MTEPILGADPEVLDAYAVDASATIAMVEPAATAYGVAWEALASAPAAPPIAAPCSGAGSIRSALAELTTVSRSVQGYADALRALDADASGQLEADELPDAAYLELFLQVRGDHTPHDRIRFDWNPFDIEVTDETPAERIAHLKQQTDRLWALSEALVDVNNDGTNGEPRQIRLDLNDPAVLDGYSREELQQVLKFHGLDGRDGPLHFLVHGFTTGTDPLETAGDHVADRYRDRDESDTTVVTIDWDSGNGPQDWRSATGNADEAAAPFSAILDALNTANPAADVKISAHSLGNKVALSAITDMDSDGPLKIDYLAIQPAIPRYGYEDDPTDFGALVSDRIDVLTITTNDGDDALNKYIDYGTIHALGEAEPDDDAIQDLIEAREALGVQTTIRDHESGLGGETGEGHLGLDPDLEQDDDSGKERDGDPLNEVYSDQIAR